MIFNSGKWDGNEPKEIEAENEQQAAEIICGTSLTDGGKPGQLRAQVSPSSKPETKILFYDPPLLTS